MEEIINRVAKSGLVTLDLEDYYHPGARVLYDLKENLFMGMILKEKDFREFLKSHDWAQYKGQNVAITCTEDAIIPTWAYMLLALQLEPHANSVVFGNLNDVEEKLYFDAINQINPEDYRDAALCPFTSGQKIRKKRSMLSQKKVRKVFLRQIF